MKNESNKIKTEDIIRMATIDVHPEAELINSIFKHLPDLEYSSEKKQNTIERIRKSLAAESTFGELLSQYLSSENLSIESLSQESGIPEDTIQNLAKDTVLPFTVPVQLMKRLIQRIGVQIDQAKKGLTLTAGTIADAIFVDKNIELKTGVAARRGYEVARSELEPKALQDRASIFQSNERYLQRLDQLLSGE